MARPVTEQNKLPAASTPWARQVTDAINRMFTRVENFISDQTNKNRANNTNIQTLTTQNQTLQAQNAKIQAQTDYLASLVTKASTGSDYLINQIPGDQTERWYDGPADCKVTLNVPTGQVLASWGVGTMELRAGNSTLYGYVRIILTTPSGWSDTIGGATRVWVTNGTYIGMPVMGQRIVSVPTNEPVTVRVQFGSWSAGTSSLGALAWYVPFVSAQVVPA